MTRRDTKTDIEVWGPRKESEPLRQPNDRDESASDADRREELAPVQHAQARAAAKDAEGPQVNTDCYSTPSSPECAQPRDPDLYDDVLRPGDPRARDAENRRGATHDPGPEVTPDGRPRAG